MFITRTGYFFLGTDRTVESCCNLQKLTMTLHFSDNFQLFLTFVSLVTGPSFMSISLLELWSYEDISSP